MSLVVAEKGSVAKAIRRAVATPIQTIALSGHFLELDFPEEYGNWWRTNPKQLFYAPTRWIIRDRKTYGELVKALKQNYRNPIVLATDNDHEGELIAYEVLLTARKVLGSSFTFKRMRFNTTTVWELRKAWENMDSNLNWGWVYKALFRHRFDLVTGAAYTRLLTVSARKAGNNVKLISWGSCQSPTLWFVVEREREIRSFKPETYYTVEAVLNVKGVQVKVSTEPIKDEKKALEAYGKVKASKYALVKNFDLKLEVDVKPLPTDTDVMLQELTKILGLSGAKVMGLAEELYAEGYISYPRTQTNMWVKVDHKPVLDMLRSSNLAKHVRLENFNPRDGRKNDGAHPPIYPTQPYKYSDVKGKIWDYVARRYLANTVYGDAKLNRWRLNVAVKDVSMNATNRYFVDEGFYRVFPYFKPRELQWIPEVKSGELLPILKVDLAKRKTKPPPHLTESELLRLMEQHGIGTDATRHEYPTLIVRRGYAEKKGKSFRSTPLGENLVSLLEKVERRLVTPETRKMVEQVMEDVEKGKLNLEEALNKSLQTYLQLYLKLENSINQNRGFRLI